MNKDKVIKDLKERNDKLLEQYRYRDIRCITLEQRLERLQKELNKKNKIIEEIKEKYKRGKKAFDSGNWCELNTFLFFNELKIY